MRKIKFRGQRQSDNKWIYGDLLQPTELCDIYEISDCESIDGSRYDIIKDTIGQFTGLYDKNGKEIYEGDIVKINAHSYDFGFEKDKIGEIRFLEGCFGFYKQFSEKEYLFNELATESGYGELDYYEVIGNIYDNPELLEEG